jgi:hypothetical protein
MRLLHLPRRHHFVRCLGKYASELCYDRVKHSSMYACILVCLDVCYVCMYVCMYADMYVCRMTLVKQASLRMMFKARDFYI